MAAIDLDSKYLLGTLENGVLRVVLDRPDRRNACTIEMYHGIKKAAVIAERAFAVIGVKSLDSASGGATRNITPPGFILSITISVPPAPAPVPRMTILPTKFSSRRTIGS